jgi:hemerythrin-like domain-containing protein
VTPNRVSRPGSRKDGGGDDFMRRLRADHAGLSRVLKVIDAQQSLLCEAPDSARPVLVEAMAYLLEYQHVHHHPREDALFESIRRHAPDLASIVRQLQREHRSGRRLAEQLGESLLRATDETLRGRRGARLARQLQGYVRHAREHMRREEAVFYARSERLLHESDWRALTAAEVPGDPAAEPRRLALAYPQLAERLAESIREVGDTGDGVDDPRFRAALRHGIEQLLECYGELLHDAMDLARANVTSLRRAGTPIAVMKAAGTIHERNRRFLSRCLQLPSRWARETAPALLAAALPRLRRRTSAGRNSQ